LRTLGVMKRASANLTDERALHSREVIR
jgi:hypothetical protein